MGALVVAPASIALSGYKGAPMDRAQVLSVIARSSLVRFMHVAYDVQETLFMSACR